MWFVSLLLLSLLFSVTPALAEPGFSEKYGGKGVRSCNPTMTERRLPSHGASPLSGISRCRLSCHESRPGRPRLIAHT